MQYFNWFQWIQFLILAFSVFFYFGLIIVWLLLGAIINPNFYLVYSSSSLSLISFIAQISQIKSTYESACAEIKKIINEIYLRTFGQLAGAIIKEVQKLTDLSTAIINSTNMDAAKEMADNLGFGEELNELCILTQGMIDNAGSTDLNQDQINFKQIKDKFIEKASEKFIRIAKDQFEVPEIIAEQLIKANFLKFDEIIDPLKSIPKDLQKLSLQYSLINKLIQLNITSYGYIRSKYWDKSLDLIKKQIFKQSEIEVLENDQSSQQTQQIIISLMQYYAGQFTVSQRTNYNQGQQNQNTKQTDLRFLEAIFGAGNKYSLIKQSFNYKEVNLNLEEQNKKCLQIQINQLIIYQDQLQMKQKEENQNHWLICSIIQRL